MEMLTQLLWTLYFHLVFVLGEVDICGLSEGLAAVEGSGFY